MIVEGSLAIIASRSAASVEDACAVQTRWTGKGIGAVVVALGGLPPPGSFRVAEAEWQPGVAQRPANSRYAGNDGG